MQPLFAMLRGIVANDPDSIDRLLSQSQLDMMSDDTGWTVDITLAAPDGVSGPLSVHGCGDDLRAVELHLPDGNRRTYRFEPMP